MVTEHAAVVNKTTGTAGESLVPNGYKRTEVGVIPRDWDALDYTAFGQIIDGDRGIDYPGAGDLQDDGHCLFLNAGNVTKKGFRFDECQFISLEKDKKLHKGKLTRGDVVLTTRGTLGNFAYFDNEVPYDHIRINSGMVILRNVSPKVSNAFQYHVLLSRIVQSQIERLSFGSAQPQLTVKGISTLKIPLPPTKAEQDAIAQALSDTAELIESLYQVIAKKRHVRQGAIQRLLHPKNTDTVRLLKEVSSLKGRIGWQGLKQTEFTQNENEPFLVTGMNFKDGAIRWSEVYHIPEARYEMAKDIQLRPADLLMTKDGTIGKVLYIDTIPYPKKASLNSHLLLFRPIKESYDPKYLYYQLSSQRFKDYVELSKSGTTFFGLSQASIGNYPAILPPLKEQSLIAMILSDMDAEILALEAKLTKAQQIKQGMMQELLTGRVRLI